MLLVQCSLAFFPSAACSYNSIKMKSYKGFSGNRMTNFKSVSDKQRLTPSQLCAPVTAKQ